jgi:NAD(P)-dependent dehydrogenase (short-subunit alcohol dehydrogenase family)
MGQPDEGIAWIVGVGAQAGLGAALARRYAREGLTLALTGRTAERVEALAAELRSAGAKAHALTGDASDERQVLALAAQLGRLGRLRAAVFNVGAGTWAPSLDLTAEQFEQTWRVTAFSGFLVGREAVRLLLAARGGSLIFTGATASVRGRPPFAAFASAKAALRSLSQSLAREFGPKGIHVAHVVIDGGIRSTRHPEAAGRPDATLDPDAIAATYLFLLEQPRSTWTWEIELRPWVERF